MFRITRKATPEEERILRTMATGEATDDKTSRRARAVVAFLGRASIGEASKASGFGTGTVRKIIHEYDTNGWKGLISVLAPRGGDFLARYDQGFWAERLVRVYLDRSAHCRAIPYGTSRSEPFTDLETFRRFSISEALLQAWSAGQKWKRPDLLLLPREFLSRDAGTDTWTPDLLHWDNTRCEQYVREAKAAVEVETSLWQVKRATVSLSFTVKEEDLNPIRNWVGAHQVPLYIIQVFYDQAFALPFGRLEHLIGPDAPPGRRIGAEVDRTTHKATYRIPLKDGVPLGDIPEPDVEGRVFKAPNGRVTVYGRLTGSHIEPVTPDIIESLGSGRLA